MKNKLKPLKPLFDQPKKKGYVRSLILYELFYLWVLGVVALVAAAIKPVVYRLPLGNLLFTFGCLCFLILYLLTHLFSHKSAVYRSEHGTSFFDSIILTFSENLAILSFLPVIGGVFSPKNSNTDTLSDEESTNRIQELIELERKSKTGEE